MKINGQPVHNWNDVRDLYLANLGDKIDFTVEHDGNIQQIIYSKNVLEQKNSDQLDIYPRLPAMVGDVVAGSPASKAGLERGDQIVSIAGEPVNSWESMTKIVQANANKKIDFIIQRNGQTLTKEITPEPADEIGEDGTSHIVGKIGIGLYYEKNRLPFFHAFTEGFNRTIFYTDLNIKALGWVVTGKKSAKEMLGGPIMITKMAGQIARTGFGDLLGFIAQLSIVLAIINVVPIPALDGGHIAIVLIEEIRRKPLSTATKIKIQQVGMAILFVLIIFVMYNDIMRLLS